MKILGFQSGHDVSYCLLEDGIPVIHEELERFTREKEPLGDGLEFAIKRLPEDVFNDVACYVHGNPGGRYGKYKEVCNKSEAEDKMLSRVASGKSDNLCIGHHQSHAANAFFSSNFDKAIIFTLDGSGMEKSITRDYVYENKKPTTFNGFQNFSCAFTVWLGEGNKITPIRRIDSGLFTVGSSWKYYTKELFGLSSGHPHGFAGGTVMAMASAGDGSKYYLDFAKAFIMGGGGHSAAVKANVKKYLPIVARSEQDRFDVAAALQMASEQVVYETMAPYVQHYKEANNICLAGGVALNTTMVGMMFDWFPKSNIFVCPVPYDGGLSIGSAQFVWHHILGNPRVKWDTHPSPFLGMEYSKQDILNHLEKSSAEVVFKTVTDDDVIELLDQQNIISLFQGGAESGRRALGNRSIVADPRSSDMKGKINEKVKHRQWYRPFAPAILREDVKDWFEKDIDSPYMSFIVKFKESVVDKVPAVVHLNGTGRLQTLTEKGNGWFYNFVKKWRAKSGVPILLNTSFNDREPIVETPSHAINCFIGTDIDYLYFSDCKILVEKKHK